MTQAYPEPTSVEVLDLLGISIAEVVYDDDGESGLVLVLVGNDGHAYEVPMPSLEYAADLGISLAGSAAELGGWGAAEAPVL